MAIPLIVGIGIDDGVHIYHRIHKERHIPTALSHCGKAVILTSLTTEIGFGSLMMSIHPGLFSLGLTTCIGIFSCLVVSLFLMPALVAIFNDDILNKGGDEL
jgi:predicted RND superfamily exporter protein